MPVDDYSPPAADSPCPCCSGRSFGLCCQPLLAGQAQANTAEQLMRSRYCAHATGHIDYIVATWEGEQRAQLDINAIRQWALSSKWLGLQVLTTKLGGSTDSEGTVEFAASFIADGSPQLHREESQFVRRDGRWYFLNS